MKPDRIHDLRELEYKLYEAVQQCIDDSAADRTVSLFVCPVDCDVLVVANPQAEGEALFAYEAIEWQSLVTADGEPDVDVIGEVASGFVFVR